MSAGRAVASVRKPLPVVVELHWRWHTSGGPRRRVWRTTWAGDQFEVLDAIEFENLEAMCRTFSIPLIEQED